MTLVFARIFTKIVYHIPELKNIQLEEVQTKISISPHSYLIFLGCGKGLEHLFNILIL